MLLLSLSIRVNRLKNYFYASPQSNGTDSLEISKQPLGNYAQNQLFFTVRHNNLFLTKVLVLLQDKEACKTDINWFATVPLDYLPQKLEMLCD